MEKIKILDYDFFDEYEGDAKIKSLYSNKKVHVNYKHTDERLYNTKYDAQIIVQYIGDNFKKVSSEELYFTKNTPYVYSATFQITKILDENDMYYNECYGEVFAKCNIFESDVLLQFEEADVEKQLKVGDFIEINNFTLSILILDENGEEILGP